MSATLFRPESLPRSLVLSPPLTDEELFSFCLENDNVRIERTKDGVIQVHPPTALATGGGNVEILRQLSNWWHGHRQGRVSDSNTGFRLPDSSMLSPDASYLSPAKLKGLTKADINQGFVHRCPGFVIELLSKSDSPPELHAKIELWLENGAALGWLVNPYKRTVHIYQPGVTAAVFTGKLLCGVGPVEGFTLDLEEVWRCYEV